MIAQLVDDFAHKGVVLRLEGDRLKVRTTSPEALTPAMRQAVADNRAAIMAFLAAAPVNSTTVEPEHWLEAPMNDLLARQVDTRLEGSARETETGTSSAAPTPHLAPVPQQPHETRDAVTSPSHVLTTGPRARSIPHPWPADLAAWVAGLVATDLPAFPFTLRPGVTVTGPRFLAELQAAASIGPAHPRARYGALQEDLRQLAALTGGSDADDVG